MQKLLSCDTQEDIKAFLDEEPSLRDDVTPVSSAALWAPRAGAVVPSHLEATLHQAVVNLRMGEWVAVDVSGKRAERKLVFGKVI